MASETAEPTVGTFLGVYVGLVVLLAATVGISFLQLGIWSIAIAVGIAATKSALIAAYFMHARYQPAVLRLASVAGFFWLMLLIVLSLSDFLTR